MELRIPFKAVCINDANRPNDIPINKWVKKGESYTVIHVAKMMVQGGMLGFKLEELNIDDCIPYQFFSASRFGIPASEFRDEVQEMLDILLKEAKEEALIPQLNED